MDLSPKSAAAHYNKGRALSDLQRYAEARLELQQACRLAPDMEDAFYQLGLAERELQHFTEAADALRRATELNPHNANAEFVLGQTLLKLNRRTEGVAALKKTVEVDPNYSQAYYTLFRALAKSDPEQAASYERQFKSLQQQDQSSDRAMTLSNSALQAEHAGNPKAAVAQMEDAIHVCGNCGSLALLHKNLGLIECRAGQLDDGEKELRIALQGLPSDPEILQSLKTVRELRERPAGQLAFPKPESSRHINGRHPWKR